jgi:prepilin-type N-terminal cleavage/methylation domain-containing protein
MTRHGRFLADATGRSTDRHRQCASLRRSCPCQLFAVLRPNRSSCHRPPVTGHCRCAFTLVELMIVIIIICLLVALLMPVLNGAYKLSLKTADAALIDQISMGCEAYHQVFHEYPPSLWEPSGGSVPKSSWSDLVWPPAPVDPNPGQTGDNTMALSGAAKLFSALSGFNTLANGAAGNVGCNDPSLLKWLDPCGQPTHRGILVSLASPWTTEDKVYGPYYEPSQKQETLTYCFHKMCRPADHTVFASRFCRRAPRPLLRAGAQETGAPILYYRANQAPATGDAWNIFRYRDNYLITDPKSCELDIGNDHPYTTNVTDLKLHPLYGFSNGTTDVDAFVSPAAQMMSDPGSLDYGICRPQPAGCTGPRTPYNANTYILISPGPDGQYFTEDDVTNFR